MLSYTDLQKGTTFILENEPYEVLQTNYVRMQQRKPVVQAKIKNLITRKTVEQTFRQNDSFQEAVIKRQDAIFIYENKGEYWFHEKGNPKNRFSFSREVVSGQGKFLKKDLPVSIQIFFAEGEPTSSGKEKPINIILPIKVDYIIKEAPPAIKGNTAQGGTKEIILENGMAIQSPLFIEKGDVVRVNTQTGEYSERIEKAN